MRVLIAILVLYSSPGCISQCVNCAPQQSYQTPCCIPPTNVQTIQSARAFTNGAQGSQVIMYYNGQRIVAGPQTQQTQQVSNFDQNAPNNYQNPGPIPGYQTQNGYQTDQSQSQYPNNLNGGVAGTATGGAVVGGVGIQGGPQEVGGNVNNGYPGQNINAGGNIGNQNQNINAGGNVPQNQNQNINAGGFVGDQTQNQGGNLYDNNQNNYGGSTLAPSGSEVGYQPFVPSGNDGYNNDGATNFNNAQDQFGGQQNSQNNQNVIYPTGGIAAGGTVGGSYNSPNSGYVNSQTQPQTYPTQVVTGGAVPNQNVGQAPGANTQYQDQINNQSGPNNQQTGGQNAQGTYNGNQQGVQATQNQEPMFTDVSGGQGQQITNSNNPTGAGSTFPIYQQGQVSTTQGFSSTPGYQQDTGFSSSATTQNPYLTQEQSTSGQQTFTNGQQTFTNGQQGFSSTSGPYLVGNNAQGQFNTNSYQSTTPTTANYNGNSVTAGGQQQSSNGLQSTTGIPVTNDNQGFIASSTATPNMPQAQYPSQQDILTYTGQSTTGSASGAPTPAPQYPSQQELGASTAATSQPQFPAQQDLGATTISQQNGNFVNQQQSTPGATPQFPSQQELVQRDQQQNGGATVNVRKLSDVRNQLTRKNVGITPQYGDMNTQYGRYSTSTASSGLQFDQPAADQQQIQNVAAINLSASFVTILLVSLLV